MSRPAPASQRIGACLVGGAAMILAARELLALASLPQSDEQTARGVGAVLGFAILAAGVLLVIPRRKAGSYPVATITAQSTGPSRMDASGRVTHEFLGVLHAWLTSGGEHDSVWPAFDQFVRESLGDAIDASRVRCYQVIPGADKLRSLAASEGRSELDVHARGGILGHVLTSGRPFYADDRLQGELVLKLAERDARWQIVWPMRDAARIVGLIAVTEAPRVANLLPAERETIMHALNATWLVVAARERLRVAELTDKATGVLTRRDFFDAAESALRDAAAEREPVVVAVLALEGLRGLDDAGAWEQRDRLVERVGRSLARHVRSDDVVGRFSDDRFAIVLRRLDSALATMIAEKLHDAVAAECATIESGSAVKPRFGLAGSGLTPRTLDELLVAAFEASERARTGDARIETDVRPQSLAGAVS